MTQTPGRPTRRVDLPSLKRGEIRDPALTAALRKLGLADGDRVGTLMWNHHEHLETYIGAPVGGFVTHTLNLRLHPDDNTYIATHAGDRDRFVPGAHYDTVVAGAGLTFTPSWRARLVRAAGEE